MFENILEWYVLSNLRLLHILPAYKMLSILLIGFPFGLLKLVSHYNQGVEWVIKSVREFWRKIKSTNEPIGWVGVIVATVGVSISGLSYLQNQQDLSLSLRCEAKKELIASEKYIYAKTDCLVKNVGNQLATIDTVEPTFYYSEFIDLQRGYDERSFHKYREEDFELLNGSLTLPHSLQPGETKSFETYVAIPIGYWMYDVGWEEADEMFKQKIAEFDECQMSEYRRNCFQDLTTTEIPNFVYERIEIPVGYGGVQYINGLGVMVSDFDYSTETEVDMLNNFYPIFNNENVPILSTKSIRTLDNIGRPWWKKYYTHWVGDGGTSITFIHATITYIGIIISILGWFVISRFILRYFLK